ncbi:hypothetical protein UG53_11670 [Vibrio sp. S512-13]|nr:hypothetical protein UG53_11670 [Vibrio sp. S512-13]
MYAFFHHGLTTPSEIVVDVVFVELAAAFVHESKSLDLEHFRQLLGGGIQDHPEVFFLVGLALA